MSIIRVGVGTRRSNSSHDPNKLVAHKSMQGVSLSSKHCIVVCISMIDTPLASNKMTCRLRALQEQGILFRIESKYLPA